MSDLTLGEYRDLAEFRYQIRRFLHFSEQQVRALGLEPQQHQLLLAIKGLPDGRPSTIGELAGRLHLKHHSVVELVDRLEKQCLVSRRADQQDHRQVLVELTRSGDHLLRQLTLAHHEELETAGPALARSLQTLMKRHRALSGSAA